MYKPASGSVGLYFDKNAKHLHTHYENANMLCVVTKCFPQTYRMSPTGNVLSWALAPGQDVLRLFSFILDVGVGEPKYGSSIGFRAKKVGEG